MKKLHLVEVSNIDTNEIYEEKCYWQEGRISAYCNKMFRKYGERVICKVFDENLNIVEEWRA